MPDANSPSPVAEYDAIIVGAGFSGLYQLHCLRDRLGLKARVLEAAEGVGGTWFWNRYPGARCDSESHSYSYTFSEELIRDWDWSERYPAHPEIRRYLNFVADRFDLKRDIQLGTRVTGASFDAATNRWTIRTEAGETFSAQFLITAVGCLSSANVPKIPGLEDFKGDWYHTGEWPQDGVDFSGQRVGLIGTGSTGIQATPVIAEEAGHLTVFQRTPNYSVPAQNAPLTEEFKAYVKANYAQIRDVMMSNTNGHCFGIQDRSVFDLTPEEREKVFEAAWAKGGLEFRANFRDILTSNEANATASEFIKSKIRSIVKDPETAAKLSGMDYPYAAKRPPIDSDYFETYNRANVALVDIRADPIDRITAAGVRTQSGAEYPLDIIVFATGFDAMTGPFLRMDIKGREGLPLAEAWEAGPRTYLGLGVKGFPNLFTITGPGSPSVLCNMPIAIEQHVEWVTACIAHMHANGIATVEATSEATDAWVEQVNAAAEATLLPQASTSWYLGANVPGKPRVFMPYAGGMATYRGICDAVAAEGYRGFEFGKVAAHA